MPEYRRVKCSGCDRELEFPITEKDFGKTVIARCPKCGPVNRVEIPVPAPQPEVAKGFDSQREPSLEELLKTFNDLFGRK